MQYRRPGLKAIALFYGRCREHAGSRRTSMGRYPQAIGRHVIEDAAIERYRAGRLSHRQVGEALGLDYWQETFLKERASR